MAGRAGAPPAPATLRPLDNALAAGLTALDEDKMVFRRAILILGVLWLAATAPAQAPRFVVDDDAYADRVTEAALKLLRAHKLVSLPALRSEVRTQGAAVKLEPPARQKLDPPDLYERLRQSTLAVGTLYKCKECGQWHFNASAGFVVGGHGIVCTCCHVVVAEDPDIQEGYLLAANAAGEVFPVRSVLAADTDSDTCFLKLEAPDLKPLPLRAGVRAGERVYCLSHPGGYYFMFTQGMVARLNLRPNDVLEGQAKARGGQTRPILFLNVTAEFAPGSSGAPIVDDAGNVVGQVASIADAGEPDTGDQDHAPSPSVPIRFCTATEEILRLTDATLGHHPRVHNPKGKAPSPAGR